METHAETRFRGGEEDKRGGKLTWAIVPRVSPQNLHPLLSTDFPLIDQDWCPSETRCDGKGGRQVAGVHIVEEMAETVPPLLGIPDSQDKLQVWVVWVQLEQFLNEQDGRHIGKGGKPPAAFSDGLQDFFLLPVSLLLHSSALVLAPRWRYVLAGVANGLMESGEEKAVMYLVLERRPVQIGRSSP